MSAPTTTRLDAQQLHDIVQNDAKKGAVVHTFNPDAPPDAKGAAVGETGDYLKGATRSSAGFGKEVSLDASKGAPIPPTITISDADKVHADQREAANGDAATPHIAADERQAVPGTLPDALAASIPDWYRIGWRAVSGIDRNSALSPEEVHKNTIAAFIKEQYYGDWYHNAGIICFAVIMSHYLTVFNMGWGSLFVLLAICSTYYTTSVARVRSRSRDDIQRELVKTRLLSEHETAEWINHFLDRFWLIYEPVLSAIIVSSVDQVLSASTPPFLDSIRLTTFTLGTKAPRVDKVRTFPKTAEDIVMMDWGISFTPTDVSDLTSRQAASKINPKIVLSIRLGKGFATAAMPILLEDISFSGLMRIRLKLMSNFPHIQVVDVSFMEKPVIDYVLKPIGGETFGFDIANIPGLSSFIRDMTHSTLGPMMYDPNVFTLNLEQLLSGTPLDAAIGVLRVTIYNARGLKGTKMGGGTPDPYVSLSLNQRAELARTKHQENTHNPTWDETKFLLINSLTEVLSMSIMDYNEHRKDSDMGAATFELAKLQDDSTLENLVVPVLRDGKERGELRFDISFYPVLTPTNVNGNATLPESSVGIARLTIHQAKDLDHTKSLSGELNPSAKVVLGSARSTIHTTPRLKHTNNPVWESSTEFLCTNRASSVIQINVIDDREFLADPVVGYISVKLDDLLEAKKEAARDWWPLSGCKTGRIRLGVEWKPLNMAGSLQGADKYAPPIGILRLWLQKATDLKNVEAALGGKSDPYVRVLSRNITMARTEVINNNLNPEWDQIVYVPVLLLECMDYQHLTKDRSLGSVELRVSDFAKGSAVDMDYPYVSLGKKELAEPLRLDKGVFKGTLHFIVEFVPAIFLKGVSFETQGDELQPTAKNTGAENSRSNRSIRTNGSSSSSSENLLPLTVTQNDAVDEGKQTASQHTESAKSSDTGLPADAVNPSGTATPTEERKYEGVEMTNEELLKRQSGIIVFNLVGGQLAKKSRLEVLLDEGYWPVMATPKSRSIHARFDQVGEGFVKELDFSQIWLRLNENDDSEKETIIAEYKIEAKTFLEQTLDGPFKFTLRDHDDRNESIVEISSKYIPVDITLEPRESINNHGILYVELMDGRDILAADRSGKSDPFAVFTLNDQKVFRSQVKKKTLTPDWNETFEVSIPSRFGSHFEIEVFDWNQIEQSKSLGTGIIELENIEPFQGTTRTILLHTVKNGDKGEVRLSLLFQPAIIAKSRKATSTFSTAGRAMTQVSGLPLGAGKGIIHGVGTAGRTVKGIFKHDNSSKASLDIPHNGHPHESGFEGMPAGQISRPVDSAGGAPAALPAIVPDPGLSTTNSQPPQDYCMLKVTVLAAKDLMGASAGDTVKPYVIIKVGDKEQKTKHAGKTTTPEWDESFRFLAGPGTALLVATVYDHKTIGKDRFIGEADVDIWRHIQPSTPTAEVWVELREGQGLLRLRLEFENGRPPSGSSPSSSPARFTSLRRFPTRDRT